jgi:hypothetical protein
MIYSWLKDCPTSTAPKDKQLSRHSHVWHFRVSRQKRLDARRELKKLAETDPEVARLFDEHLERDKFVGEDSEPEKTP